MCILLQYCKMSFQSINKERTYWQAEKQVNKWQRQRAQSCGNIELYSRDICKTNVFSPAVLNDKINSQAVSCMPSSSAVKTDVFYPPDVTTSTGLIAIQ